MSTHSQFLSRFASRFLPYALLIGLLTGCSEPEQPDTLLIDNIQGYSFNNQRELFNFSAMAIRDGKVLATGDSEIAANYPKAEKFDGQGKTLIPGIIDAHGHVSSLGFTLLSIDVPVQTNQVLSTLNIRNITLEGSSYVTISVK